MTTCPWSPSTTAPPPRTYTTQEKQELGVEREEEDTEIQVGRVLGELSGGLIIFGRVEMEPLLAAITELEVGQATSRDQDLTTLMKLVQTGLWRK